MLSDDLAKDLEIVPSLKSDDGNLSMAVNCPSIRSATPSLLGDGNSIAMTPSFKNAFQDATLQFTTPTNLNDTVIEVNSYPAYRNALMNTTFVKDSDIDATTPTETTVEMEKEKKMSFASKESAGSSLSSRSFSLYLPHRRTSFCSTSGSRAIQAKNKEDIKLMLDEITRNSLRVEDIHTGGSSRLSHRLSSRLSHKTLKEKRRSVRVSIAKKGLRRCQTVIVMPTVDDDDNDFQPDLRDVILKTEEEMKDLKREAEVENVVLTQKPLKVRFAYFYLYMNCKIFRGLNLQMKGVYRLCLILSSTFFFLWSTHNYYLVLFIKHLIFTKINCANICNLQKETRQM